MTYKFDEAKILIADDMKPMLGLVKSLLTIFGCKKLYTAQNGEEAYEILCKENPDLVITDWMMDPMDGVELTQRIRKDPRSPNPYVPVILMTGFSSRMRVEISRDMGVTEFLVKPFTAKDLYGKIEHVIERPRQFVDSRDFFGPDRRRRRPEDYEGPRRRDEDTGEDTSGSGKKSAADVLKKLLKDAKEIGKKSS